MLALIASDVLKLRRRRGMLAISLLLTAGLMAVAIVVMAIQHGGNPAKYGPAGGLGNFKEDIEVISLAALIIGTIIGATSGTQDIESGVFRDLAATGRSRMALFASRVAGAWAVVLPILAVTGGLAAAGCIALAGSLAAPGAGAIAAGVAAVLAAGALSAAIAVGVSALVGSRGPVIGIMLAFYLAVQNLLLAMGFLGGVRQIVPDVAIRRIGDLEQASNVEIGSGAAILVLIAWSAVTLGLGAWRTKAREI
jgi:ABC-type transport system involved in multi-copper enzyme maturation permease subunit